MSVKNSVNKSIQMVNIWDKPITVHLGGTPGDGVTEYEIGPGEKQGFHEGLCKPVPGAGSEKLPPILHRRSLRVFPDGVRRPVLIAEADAKKTKEQYATAVAEWQKNQAKATQPNAGGGK